MTLPVVILAGGIATRMRPHTDSIPKALLPVNGMPFAELQLRWLKTLGVDHVVFSIGYRGDQIINAIGDGSRFGVAVDYVDDGPKRLGTGGGIRRVIDAGVVGEAFSVINGDSYLTLDIKSVEATFFASGLSGLMTVMHNRNK